MGDNDKQDQSGKPPEPKIGEDTSVSYRVIDKDGNIGMVFDHAVAFFAMPPLQAIGLGIAIIQMATNRIAQGKPSKIIKLRDM